MVFNEYRSRSDRLKNIIRYVNEFVLNKSVIQLNRKTVFYLIKLYTDKINIAMNEQLMVGTKIDSHFYPLGDFYNAVKKEVAVNRDFCISLARNPVVTKIWDKERLVENLSRVAEPDNPWQQDKINHMYNIYLPMGVTEIHNGNHSSNSGIIKGEGELKVFVNPPIGFAHTTVYDMSDLYDEYYYDGTYFRSKLDKHFKMKGSFESGCIFEIGRCIQKKGISFI